MKTPLLVCVALVFALVVNAQVKMPYVFSDHMVLQREAPIALWGWGTPGAIIKVDLNKQSIETTVEEDGAWNAYFPKQKAGGPFQMKVQEIDDEKSLITFNDVLIGDVWLASGQSNMEWQVQQADGAEEEIAQAHNDKIRLFKVPHAISLSTLDDVHPAEWAVCDTTSVKEITAVGYYFAKSIQKEVGVPVGILQTTWGGTPVEAWTSREMLASIKEGQKSLESIDTLTEQHFKQDTIDIDLFWDIVYNPKSDLVEELADSKYNDKGWSEVTVPGNISKWEPEFYEGIIWLRKKVKLGKEYQGKDLEIELGHPEMNYSLYFNGKEICKNMWNANPTHNYTISSDLVQKGENTISMRVAALWGGGGLNGSAEDIKLSNGEESVRLVGEWLYKKDLEPKIPHVHYYHINPCLIYNAMLKPLIPYALKGMLWYQGEQNEGEAFLYRKFLPLMINDWRIRWKQGNLPFLLVQLPNYMERKTEPVDEKWAVLRESQTIATYLPNTSMTCIIDCGVADNIHPTNKTVVGSRLANVAAKEVYGKDVVAYGPVFKDCKIEGRQVRINYKNAQDGLTTTDGVSIKGFAVAGEDQIFHWAKAVVENNTIVLSCEAVDKPVAVRYAWANNPDVNLVNNAGLPAVPFRTDSWEVITE